MLSPPLPSFDFRNGRAPWQALPRVLPCPHEITQRTTVVQTEYNHGVAEYVICNFLVKGLFERETTMLS